MSFKTRLFAGQLPLIGFVDALNALCLIRARLDVLVAAGTHGHMRQKRLFYPFAMPLKRLRREIHIPHNNTS